MSDLFDAAADEAVAELGGSEAAVEEGLPESTPDPTDLPAETPPAETAPAVEAGVEPPSQEPSPQAQAPWWNERLGETVEYKGVTMTLEDALANGLRQADYTRKTQELAQRAQVADWGEQTLAALKADPVGGLRSIAEQLGLIPKDQQGFDPSEEPDPALVELASVKSEIQTLKDERLAELVRREISDVRGKFPDFTDDVLALVAELGGQGVGLSIEEGYYLWKGRKASETAQATAAAQAKATAEAKALEAARAAQVAAGHSPAANVEDRTDYGELAGGDLFDAIATEVFGGRWDDPD